MIAKNAILLLLLQGLSSLQCLNCEVTEYYVTPDLEHNATCVQDNATFAPCYSIQELNETLLSYKSSVSVFFLRGKHVVISHFFTARDTHHLMLTSWDEQNGAEIECTQLGTQMIFVEIGILNVSAMHFTSCVLRWAQDPINELDSGEERYDRVLNVWNSVFAYAYRTRTVITVENLNSVSIQGCVFHSNYGHTGIITSRGTELYIFNSTFRNNTGGLLDSKLIFAQYSQLRLNGSLFLNNTGRAVHSIFSDTQITETIFKNNNGGAVNLDGHRVIGIIHNSTFQGNVAERGGAIFVRNVPNLEVNFSLFEGNRAMAGGAIYSIGSNTHLLKSEFANNFAEIFESPSSTVSTSSDAGAIFCDNGAITMDYVLAHHNTAVYGGFLLLSNCTMLTRIQLTLTHNTAIGSGGAIYAYKNSAMTFMKSVVIFAYNFAEQDGAAMYLNNSNIVTGDYYNVYRNITFAHNTASGKGGALFVLDSSCPKLPPTNAVFLRPCFLRELIPISNKYLIFTGNKASSGSVLYGGLLDRCSGQRDLNHQRILLGIEFFKNVSIYEPQPQAISSDPIKICYLISVGALHSLEPECDSRVLDMVKMRGEAIRLALAALDQDGNPVAGVVRARYEEIDAQLDKGEVKRQLLGGNYTDTSYHIFTNKSRANLVLWPEGVCSESKLSTIKINISVVPCMRGFEQNYDRCICDRRLKQLNVTSCHIDARTISKKGDLWLTIDEDYLRAHRNCPLDYCQFTADSINLEIPDGQCANIRSGILCGGCQDNYSIALGSSRCLECTSKYTFVWLLVIFAVAGIILVAFLLLLNLTISSGTINGLLFYANVVSLSGLLSLRSCSLHPLVSVYMAWINLDLGIETCFYPGMNTYQKTWLQFVFPVYIWLLVIAIIVASHYSSRAMRIFGRNNIAILATLFILSYTKLLITIVTALTFTSVLQSPADNVNAPFTTYRVWTYDGNVEYLRGKHAPLFIVALLSLLLLFLPYTLLLISGQFLRSMSVRRCWTSRLIRNVAFISIMDAYHAPYSKTHRYWTGFMLLVRCFLFLAFATNTSDDAMLTNLFIISLAVMGILTLKTFTTKIYKAFWTGFLELCFLLNLGILSCTLYYLKGKNADNNDICGTITASVAFSLVTFLGILGYHFYLQSMKMKMFIIIQQKIQQWLRKLYFRDSTTSTDEPTQTLAESNRGPTTSQIELRESLLESK